MVRGRCSLAVTRYDPLTSMPATTLTNRIEFAENNATVDMWCDRPQAALDRLLAVLWSSTRSTPPLLPKPSPTSWALSEQPAPQPVMCLPRKAFSHQLLTHRDSAARSNE